ncbi:MAG: hypothetical protein F6K11_04995 [Leptolyngbya sp. SIO3F4]|nr:hypothetical protein [Leptolyngbya sp. SIO3F4]
MRVIKSSDMKEVGVEITCYALTDNYLEVVEDFLERMRAYEMLELKTNHMSTRVLGTYEDVMHALQTEMKTSFEQEHKVSFVMKVLNDPIRDGVLDR